LLYQIAQSSHYTTDFHDITTGNNSFYPAKTGYDDATGLGSFNGANLYSDLLGPSAPTGLVATPGNMQVALSWTASAGAVSYNVKRGGNGGPYTTISTGGAVTTPSYTDSTAANGTTYYYVVSAVNGLTESANSAQVSATPEPPTAPTAVLGVSAVAGNDQATVSFSPPASNGGSPIISYTATATPGPTTATGPSSPIVVAPLINGTTYTFTVTARNAVGAGAPSTSSPSVTPSAKIYRAAGAGAYSLIATEGPSISYIDKSTLAKGVIYKYEVTAVNSIAESPPSNVWTVNY
jgi:fibronectin type 3 domain-containing protein